MNTRVLPTQVLFNRPKKYKIIRRLGSGACGDTVLLHDEEIDCNFVAKKYNPVFSKDTSPVEHLSLLQRFKEEARILFQLNHPNIVRVFNFYDYPEFSTGYIIMEYVEGVDLLDYLKHHPLHFETVFSKVIDGFVHLENRGVLHRDIRPMNILVDGGREPRIIDFGFGKRLDQAGGDDKSISLNWWCEPPPEFSESLYDHQTEVYFVGKLFEEAIVAGKMGDFKYKSVVREMAMPDRNHRFDSFGEVQRILAKGQFQSLSFSDGEKQTYKDFADSLLAIISNIEQNTTYCQGADEIIEKLEDLYRDVMLEDYVSSPARLLRIFLRGNFKYYKDKTMEVALVKTFLDMLKGYGAEKRAVVIRNLFGRFDALDRFHAVLDDEIPF